MRAPRQMPPEDDPRSIPGACCPTTTARGHPRDVRGDAAPELARGRPRHRSGAVRLHVPEPRPLPVAVVLGLVLHRDRVAPFRPARSRRELESLLAAQRADGFIGHTIFWNTPLTGRRRFTYNVTSPNADDDGQHPTAGPGLGLADRGRRPGREPGDRQSTTTGWPPTATSTATGSSGSSSPTSRASTPPRSSTPSGAGRPTTARVHPARAAQPPARIRPAPDRRRRRPRLLRGRRRTSCTGCRCMALGTAVAHADDRRAACTTRRPACSSRWPGRDPSGRAPAHLGRAVPRSRCPTCPSTSAAGWSRSTCSTPAASGCPCRRRRSPRPSPAFSTREDHFLWIRRYWRGPTWINAAWLVWLGLVRLGYDTEADVLASRLAPTVKHERPARVLRPVHRPRHGRGRLRLVHADPRDARHRPPRPPSSYLGVSRRVTPRSGTAPSPPRSGRTPARPRSALSGGSQNTTR